MTEELVSSMVKEIKGSYKISYHANGPYKDPVEIDFTPPWCARAGGACAFCVCVCCVCVCVRVCVFVRARVCVCPLLHGQPPAPTPPGTPPPPLAFPFDR